MLYTRYQTIIDEIGNTPEGISFSELWLRTRTSNTMALQTFSNHLQQLVELSVVTKEPKAHRRGQKVSYKLSQRTTEFRKFCYARIVDLLYLFNLIRSVRNLNLTARQWRAQSTKEREIFSRSFHELYLFLCDQLLDRYIRDSIRLSLDIAGHPKSRVLLESLTEPYLEILMAIHLALAKKLPPEMIDEYFQKAKNGTLTFPRDQLKNDTRIKKIQEWRERFPRGAAKIERQIDELIKIQNIKVGEEFTKLRKIIEHQGKSPDLPHLNKELRKMVEELTPPTKLEQVISRRGSRDDSRAVQD